MLSLALFLALYYTVIVDGFTHRWSYFEELPSQQGTGPKSGNMTLLCAFQMLNSNAVVTRFDEEKNECITHSEITPGYTYYRRLIDSQTQLNEHQVRKRAVEHYMYTEIKIGDTFRFVILKLSHHGFDISFQNNNGAENSLSAKATNDQFVLTDRFADGSPGSEKEITPYPFSDLKEYTIVFQVQSEHWKIMIDNAVIATYNHSQPFADVKRIKVTCSERVIFLNELNIISTNIDNDNHETINT